MEAAVRRELLFSLAAAIACIAAGAVL